MGTWETNGKSDDWFTPAYIFDALGCRFDLDVAAPVEGPRYVPCDEWFSSQSLERDWQGFIWMNAPFGGRNGLAPWLEKFVVHGNGIALVPDRTSAPWFQAVMQRCDAVLFVSPKVKFERPDGSLGEAPANGTALIACGGRGLAALVRASGVIGQVVFR